jgi:excisionase family DNA binding protein
MAVQNLTKPETSNPFEVIFRDLNLVKQMLIEIQKTNRQQEAILPEVISIDEAAEFFRVSKSRMYQLTSRNQVPHYKQGSRVLFRRSELLTWMTKWRQMDTASAKESCDTFMAGNSK